VSDQPAIERTVILEIRNHHGSPAPRIEIHPEDYVSYWMNGEGEQLVFVRRRGESHATLYHGDLGWGPVHLVSGSARPGVALDPLEQLWLSICWAAANQLHR
jgi:hypothetical protein